MNLMKNWYFDYDFFKDFDFYGRYIIFKVKNKMQ